MNYAKFNLATFSIAFAIMVTGCTNMRIIRSSPFAYNHTDDTVNDCSFSTSSWKKELGGNWTRDSIPRALDILCASVNWEDGFWVFEIMTMGDIKEAWEKYGAAIQFRVNFHTVVGHKHGKSMYTTDKTGQGFLVIRAKPEIHVLLKDDGTFESARLVSKQILLDSVRVETKGRKVMFYLPAKWINDSVKWNWIGYSYFVPSPVKPIPTDIPHLFFLPSVDCAYPFGLLGCVWGPGQLWRTSKPASERPK